MSILSIKYFDNINTYVYNDAIMKDLDYKIITALRKDGRYNYTELSKELGVNVSTISRRINTMLEQDMIQIIAVPNPFKMGYKASAIIALEVDVKRIDEICAKLIGNPNISLILTAFGRFDVILLADFYEMPDLNDYIKKKLPLINGITKIYTYFISSTIKRYFGIFDYYKSVGEAILIDDIDWILIEELGQNGRMKYGDIAQKIGVDVSTVSRRVNRLIKENIIKIMAVPNPSKLGFPANAFIAIHADTLKIKNICDRLSSHPEVHYIVTLMNDFDIMIGVQFPSPEILYNFIKYTISNVEGVLKIETFVRAEFKKRIYTWLDI